MKKTSKLLLYSLPLAALLLFAMASQRPSQAQESQQDPAPQADSPPPISGHILRHAGVPSPQQTAALQRARLERELVLAERSAQMLVSLEDALSAMARSAQ